jgi:hypothetical protein
MIQFERRKECGHPNFLDVVRMYRKERELSFDEAKELAIKEFDKRGWTTRPFASKDERSLDRLRQEGGE